ncbi:hypothetical protein FPQ18DRAFT_252216 [Pyronema domesticum]|nr:hypothetical protein FPQ18DRAFT_252216 [Pyronema domesticum]
MSLGRSITKKTSKYGFGSSSSSSEEKRLRRNSVSKAAISGPVELTSTTNPIAYTAPSLRNSLSQGSISSSSSSPGGSPISPGGPLSPISGDESDHSENFLMPANHLSSYFTSSDVAAIARNNSGRPRNSSNPPPVARNSGYLGFSPTQQPPKELHSLHSRTFSAAHPFGAELAQVQEMAEEIAGMKVGDAEEQFMLSRGLLRFRAQDYEKEIWNGMGGVFEDELPDFAGAGWI